MLSKYRKWHFKHLRIQNFPGGHADPPPPRVRSQISLCSLSQSWEVGGATKKQLVGGKFFWKIQNLSYENTSLFTLENKTLVSIAFCRGWGWVCMCVGTEMFWGWLPIPPHSKAWWMHPWSELVINFIKMHFYWMLNHAWTLNHVNYFLLRII